MFLNLHDTAPSSAPLALYRDTPLAEKLYDSIIVPTDLNVNKIVNNSYLVHIYILRRKVKHIICFDHVAVASKLEH
jgi:hypothetical protein